MLKILFDAVKLKNLSLAMNKLQFFLSDLLLRKAQIKKQRLKQLPLPLFLFLFVFLRLKRRSPKLLFSTKTILDIADATNSL